MNDLQDELNTLIQQSRALWAKLAMQPAADNVVIELSKAITALRNTRDLLQYPGAKLVDVILADYPGTDSHYHASHPTKRFETLCGYEPPLTARIIPEHRVPTCPECLQRLGFALTPTDLTDLAQIKGS